MQDKRFKIWLFKEERILNLKPVLSLLFDSDFEYDFENVWEWMDGYSKRYNVKVNIGRAHCDWEVGSFQHPIMIMVDFDNSIGSSLELNKIVAEELFKHLFEPIHYGYLTITPDDSYHYFELGTFNM
jgi:hypothetical protein